MNQQDQFKEAATRRASAALTIAGYVAHGFALDSSDPRCVAYREAEAECQRIARTISLATA